MMFIYWAETYIL